MFHHALRLSADASRVVIRPFDIGCASEGGGPSRTERIIDAVLRMSRDDVSAQRARVRASFQARHHGTARVFLRRFDELADMLALDGTSIDQDRRELIGAFLSHEYSYAAAALMNPSVVLHVDQTGVPPGALRILMSMRAVGEGHISSVTFREGLIGPGNTLTLDAEPPLATLATDAGQQEGTITVQRPRDTSLSGTVIFPMTAAQCRGLEDLRLTRFTHDDGAIEWIGTYTAYDGMRIQSELLRTRDFDAFTLSPLSGPAARNKGMALFPRTIGGRYAMIGRQDGENIHLLESESLDHWHAGRPIMTPRHPWELIQMGNCGPPIELDEGWLLLTHGVGPMRTYAIGAALLDKQDPAKVIGRTAQPILSATGADREGYVPNVVYSCGAVRHGDTIFLPYGLADSSIAFAFIPIASLLTAL